MSVKRESDWESWDFCIRIAGNTGPRAIIALRQKGYDVRQRSFERENDVFQNDFEAKKDGRLFSATTPEELLGLVAIWETRGENWVDTTDAEWRQYEELVEQAKIYDVNGNEVTED